MAVKSFNEYVEIKTTNNIIDDDGHLKDLSDDSVIEKLNTFVGSISDREYLVAEKAVDELRQKLICYLHSRRICILINCNRFAS